MFFRIFLIGVLAVCATMAAPAQKLTFAILNIKNGSDVSVGEAEIISDRLRIEIFKTGAVDVMEREQMQSILKEQGFQQSGACTDEGCLVQMGQLLGVQFLVAGSIGKLGSLYLVNARSVNVKTGKIEKVVSVDIKGNIEDVVDELPRIARQLTSADDSEPIVIYNKDNKPEATSSPSSSEPPDSGTVDESITPPDKVDCRADIILEAVNFGDKISFKLGDDNTKDIHEDICDAINEFFERDVRVIAAARIGELPVDCRAPVVRVRLDTYSAAPGGREQFVGTAQATFSFFETVRAENPGAQIAIKESGDRHWGDQTPFVNAFEAIAERLADELSDDDFLKDLRKKLDK
jgi:TolB-like protein